MAGGLGFEPRLAEPVEPVHPLLVDGVPLAPQQHPKPPVAEPATLRGQFFQAFPQQSIIGPPAPATHARPVRSSNTARPPLAHREEASQMSRRLAASSRRHHFFPKRSF